MFLIGHKTLRTDWTHDIDTVSMSQKSNCCLCSCCAYAEMAKGQTLKHKMFIVKLSINLMQVK